MGFDTPGVMTPTPDRVPAFGILSRLPGLALACLLVVNAFAATGPARKPNIVFVLIDDFGYADSGPYGAKDIRTPNFDRLAREGVKLTDFYSHAPVCSPTSCGFMTGRWQQRYGFEWAMGYAAENFRRDGDRWVPETDMHSLGLPATVPTLPKHLKAAGYATGAFGKWHLGYRDEYNPLRHGFDEYFGELLGHADYYTHAYYDGTYALRDGLEPVKVEGYLTDLINRRAAQFVAKHAREPFFLYVPHLAVHAPYQPPGRPKPSVTKENMSDGNRAIYAQMVEKVDEGIGMILAELERAGVLDDTLFVVSADNGGAHYADNRPLFNRKTTLWEGGIRVPCLMRWPRRLPQGAVTSQVGITMDLTATFAAAAGVAPAARAAFEGIDLLPHLVAGGTPQPRTLFWRTANLERRQKAVRHGSWKYVRDGPVDLLFDLQADIGERTDLSVQRPEVLKDIKQRLAHWEADLAKERPPIWVR